MAPYSRAISRVGAGQTGAVWPSDDPVSFRVCGVLLAVGCVSVCVWACGLVVSLSLYLAYLGPIY